MKIEAKKVNAFTKNKEGGNPAGVVLKPPDLKDKQMALVSKKLGVSETSFVFPSEKADYKVRFFSPSTEVDLCGHATIATFFTIAKTDLKPTNKKIIVSQETKAGVLPVEIHYNEEMGVDRVMMIQDKAILKDISLDIFKIADSLNISEEKIDQSVPKQIVSTGLFTLPMCIKSFETLENMKPNFKKIQKLCKKLNVGSFHVFTFDTIESDSVYHARNFAPLYGINEDPVTGTANGAICSYLMKNNLIKEKNLKCEQGDIIGRPGRVFVKLEGDIVKVGGKASIEKEVNVQI